MKHIDICVVGVLSILYIVVILIFRGNDVWVLFRTGNLNELGDFLAGFFTPLAFGWLVYGYLLQSKELRLQREELALTRDQLGQQTELLQEQVTANHQDSIPHFTATILNNWNWEIENKGGNAKNIELWNLGEVPTVEKLNSLPRGASFVVGPKEGGSHCYEARFTSERSERFCQKWEIKGGMCNEITHGPEPLATGK